MLKQLLKYEFKATKNLYGALYLALALLSVVMGVTFRQQNTLAQNVDFQRFLAILTMIYMAVILAIAVLCFVNTVQRFYQNLLGREGYLMHTLPVTESQLILSKLITSMVWVLCSGLVGIVCITVMIAIGAFDSETLGMLDWDSWKQLWQVVYGELNDRFWFSLVWTLLTNLVQLAGIILCVYAACMVAHQFPKHVMVVGIVAFIGLNLVENWVDHLLGLDSMVTVASAQSAGSSIGTWLAQVNVDLHSLLSFLVSAAFAAGYFYLTRWLMKNKLNLE